MMALSQLRDPIRLASLLMLILGLQVNAFAHHDRAPDTGPDGMLQHMEEGTHMMLELVMPHRLATGNQVLLNVFAAGGGDAVQPERITASFRPADSGSEPHRLTLERTGPTYGAAVNLPRAGHWLLEVEAFTDSGESDTFVIEMELY